MDNKSTQQDSTANKQQEMETSDLHKQPTVDYVAKNYNERKKSQGMPEGNMCLKGDR
ncbi:hypothetical protein [Parapedobacter tibetensis]|uniref:hypothetical protein n=1 Tax=Parapedobacter tibetensis TaxID=2972951 RepID=UPI00214D5D7B|nr:hypothetical protein [Parapedobacter tibetensis]